MRGGRQTLASTRSDPATGSRPAGPGIEELLGGKQIEYPPAAQTNVTHKKAPKAKLVSSLERKAQEYARNKAA